MTSGYLKKFFLTSTLLGYQGHQTWLEVRKSDLEVKQEPSQVWKFSKEAAQQHLFEGTGLAEDAPPPWKPHCHPQTLPQVPRKNGTSYFGITWSNQSDECTGLASLDPMVDTGWISSLWISSPRAEVPPLLPYSNRGHTHTEEGRIDAGQPKKTNVITISP